jgi:prepilin-type N-terminal cleavage/methylation domain-containing protein
MKFASTGSPVASPSPRPDGSGGRGGFTLLEALVALTVLSAFAAVLGPLLFQSRRIMLGADDRVAAQILLRALLNDPMDSASLSGVARDGESAGLRWRIIAEPTTIGAMFPRGVSVLRAASASASPPVNWVAYRVVARVSWAQAQSITGETVRLGTLAP